MCLLADFGFLGPKDRLSSVEEYLILKTVWSTIGHWQLPSLCSVGGGVGQLGAVLK